jgi:hypothetical protein
MSEEIRIVTDAAGFVLDCSAAAVDLIGYSTRGARRRELPNMFVRERPQLIELLRAAQGEVIERSAHFRPNDRKAIPVRFRLSRGAPGPNGEVLLEWTFTLRWPVGMRLPEGVDRRQLVTVWRAGTMRCVVVPGGENKRRLFVCADDDVVIHEEQAPTISEALARAAELQRMAANGALGNAAE